MDSRSLIDRFLAGRRLAVVGVSRNPQDFSRALFSELCKRGYEAIPVRPEVDEIDGRKAYPRVQDIPQPVDGAIVMTSPEVARQIVRDCDEAHVPLVWLHRGAGKGAVSDEAVGYCHAHGIEVVEGECPFMFLGGSIHDFHRSMRELTGKLPLCEKEQAAAERRTKVILGILVGLELFVALGALYGGGSMLANPTGSPMGLPPPEELPGLRFGSYLVPGIVLLLANFIFPLSVVLGAATKRKWSIRGHALAGMVLTGWTAVEVLMLGWISFLQPLMLATGIALFALGSLFQSRKDGQHRRLTMAPQT